MATSIIKPVHAGIKRSFSLPTTSASYTAVTGGYKYTWTSSLVTEGCRVKVEFSSTNTNTTNPYVEYDKKSGGGGIDFIVTEVPATEIPVVATIICAQTGNTTDVKDIDVSTSTNIGALGANVNEALDTLNSNINGESITVTVWNASSYDIRCKKYGSFCIVDGTFTSSNSGNAYNFLSIPITGINCMAAARDINTNGLALIYNNINGESATTFAISGSTQGHSFLFNMCFMID